MYIHPVFNAQMMFTSAVRMCWMNGFEFEFVPVAMGQKHSQCLKVFPVLLGNRTPWQMGSGFSCQSWLSHEPMRGSPCPSGSFAYTRLCQESHFGFVVLQLSLSAPSFLVPHLWMVLWRPIKQPGRGDIASSYLLANLLSAEMSAS